MHNPIMELEACLNFKLYCTVLHLYAKPSLVNQIENVKGPFLWWKVDMMKFEECENHYETCQESLK